MRKKEIEEWPDMLGIEIFRQVFSASSGADSLCRILMSLDDSTNLTALQRWWTQLVDGVALLWIDSAVVPQTPTFAARRPARG